MTQISKRKIVKSLSEFPDFDKMSLTEEAEWWEAHDLSKIWDELDDVKVTTKPGVFKVPNYLKRMTSAINIRLDPTDHQELKTVASKKGLGITTLARMWILERLEKTKGHPQTA